MKKQLNSKSNDIGEQKKLPLVNQCNLVCRIMQICQQAGELLQAVIFKKDLR
jgi:hypothetical protein